MILSRLALNPLSRDVARSVSDAQHMHRLVMCGFANGGGANGRARHGVLHRLEVDAAVGALVLYVQSRSEPDWTELAEGVLVHLEGRPNPELRELSELDAIADRQVLRFRLRANATRRVDTKSMDGRRRHGRRVPHRDDERCLAWLVRQGRAHGFELVERAPGHPEVVLVREPVQTGRREGRTLTFEGARFDGLLRVRAVEAFRAAVVQGIGPAKAYGFGLLSIRAVQEG